MAWTVGTREVLREGTIEEEAAAMAVHGAVVALGTMMAREAVVLRGGMMAVENGVVVEEEVKSKNIYR